MATAEIHRAEEVMPDEMHHEHDALVPTYVWDLVVRITHWAIVLSMILLAITGIYIGHPWGSSSSGPAGAHFTMGWVRVLHFYGAIVFALAVLSRIAWAFIGPRRSGWRQFVPTSRRRLRDMVSTFQFYSLIRTKPPACKGHNPLAGLFYMLVFGLYLVMIVTGLALYSVDSFSHMRWFQWLLPLFHGAQGARLIHHVTMWLLIGFVVQHVYSAMLTARVEKNGTMDSMFSGYKFLPKDLPDDDD